MMAATVQVHRRILVVEDEMLIAIELEAALGAMECVVVGPVSKLDAAVRMAREEQLDAAILDVTIRGGEVYPVAEILEERHIPFIFASGYSDWALPEAFRGNTRLQKPFSFCELERALNAVAPQAYP